MSVGTIYKNVECDPAKSSCGVGGSGMIPYTDQSLP
jgi:hypothetical protein